MTTEEKTKGVNLDDFFKQSVGRTPEEMAHDLSVLYGREVTVEDVNVLWKRWNDVRKQNGVKRETYWHFNRRKLVSWNEPEGSSFFKYSIFGYRKHPATVSTHKDDLIDGEAVVTSVIHQLHIDVWFGVFEFEVLLPCEHYKFKGELV